MLWDAKKVVLQVGMGLRNRWSEGKSQEITPTHHEHEAKWEIPGKAPGPCPRRPPQPDRSAHPNARSPDFCVKHMPSLAVGEKSPKIARFTLRGYILTLMTRYYYTKDGTDVQGPILQADIQAMYSTGILDRNTQVCQEGADAWQPLSDICSKIETTKPAPPNIHNQRHHPARWGNAQKIVLVGVILFVVSAAIALFPKFQKTTPRVSQTSASASPVLHTEITPIPATAKIVVMETPSPSPEPPQLSDGTKRDIQDILIAGDRLFDLAGNVIQCSKTVEMDTTLLDIAIDAETKLAQIGSSANKQEVDAGFAKTDADKKRFDDALSKYSEVQVTAKTKIDFLNIPNSPSVKASLQEASNVWIEFKNTAAEKPSKNMKTLDKLEKLRESAAGSFDKAKAILKEQFPPDQ